MGILDRKKLLQKQKLEIVQVDLGNDEFVFVKEMTGHERDQWEQSLLVEKKDEKGITSYERSLEDFRAKLAVCTLCDSEGELLLESRDCSTLSQNMGAKRLETIINAAQKLNKISEEDKEALVKNSNAELADNSSSGSAKN
jgi:hypothetical protein